MSRTLFEKILDYLVASDAYSAQKKDALGCFVGIFAQPKTYLDTSHVSLWIVGRSVGRFNKDGRINNTQQSATLL